MRASLKIAVGLLGTCAFAVSLTAARSQDKPRPKASPSAVVGNWTGTWGPYIPARAPEADRAGDKAAGESAGRKQGAYTALQKQLDCKVALLPNGEYEATFEGECGRPYKYTIKMTGRASGGSVLFKGTTDLGEKDGGVYDWIGRATEKEFLGFYTSGSHTGTFTLTRPK